MWSRNAENELGNESREVEAGGDTNSSINSDPRPVVQGEEAVVEKKQSRLCEEHGEGIEWG